MFMVIQNGNEAWETLLLETKIIYLKFKYNLHRNQT